MRCIFLVALALSLTGCVTRSIQSPPAKIPSAAPASELEVGKRLTLERAIQRALQRNPLRDTLRAEIDWVQAEGRSKQVARAPQVRLNTGRNEGKNQSRVALRMYPPSPWVGRELDLRSTYLARFAQTRFTASEHALAMKVRTYFLSLRQLKRLGMHLDRIVEIRTKHFEAISGLARGGQALASDVMEARLDLLDSISEQARIDREGARIRGELAVAVGVPEPLREDQLEFGEEPELAERTEMNYESLLETALGHRADLAAVVWRRHVAEADLRAARMLRIPWISHLQGAVADESDSSGSTWSIQAAIDLPFGKEIGAEVDLRKAERKRYAAELERLRLQIAEEIRLAMLAVNSAKEHFARLEAERNPILGKILSDLNHDQIGGTFRSNLRSKLRRRILEADKNRITALDRLETARLELTNVLGIAVPITLEE